MRFYEALLQRLQIGRSTAVVEAGEMIGTGYQASFGSSNDQTVMLFPLTFDFDFSR
eukprot:m.276742 g.276742  ORF g.276742 m.276742 type:complete len:56 (+) comp17701_c0_seq2:4420-4587(+)